MKNALNVTGLVVAVTLGFTIGRITNVTSVKAQTTPILTPHLLCQNQFDCGQYVVQVATQRGFGRWSVYQVPDQDHVIDTSQLSLVGGGNPSTSVTFYEPDPRSSVVATISAAEQQ